MKLKINKNIILFFLLFIEAAAIAGGFYFLNIYAEKIHSVHSELTAWQRKDQDLRHLQEDYTASKDLVKLVNDTLPAKSQIIGFFEELENLASQSGVLLSINMVKLPEEDQGKKLATANLNLIVKGSFGQIESFIKSLETIDQLVLVRQLVYNAPKGLGGEISGTVFIKTYFSL